MHCLYSGGFSPVWLINCEAAGKQGFNGTGFPSGDSRRQGQVCQWTRRRSGIKALVLGGGIVGKSVASVLHSLGAWVTVMDINIGTLREIGKQFNEEINTQISNRYNIKKLLPEIDVVYNCVKWPKDAKEFLIDREMVIQWKKGGYCRYQQRRGRNRDIP